MDEDMDQLETECNIGLWEWSDSLTFTEYLMSEQMDQSVTESHIGTQGYLDNIAIIPLGAIGCIHLLATVY
jgi:hypothetical protein